MPMSRRVLTIGKKTLNAAVVKYFWNVTFGKKNITPAEVVFVQFFSLTDVSKQNIKLKTENTMPTS